MAEPVEEDLAAAVMHWAQMFPNVGLGWDEFSFLRDNWDGPIVLKGITSVDDAKLAAEHGVDGLVVSNHGGRQVDGAIAALDALRRSRTPSASRSPSSSTSASGPVPTWPKRLPSAPRPYCWAALPLRPGVSGPSRRRARTALPAGRAGSHPRPVRIRQPPRVQPYVGGARVKAVIFDLDDTLFAHTSSATAAIHAWVPRLGGTPTDELVAQWFVTERHNFDQWLAGAVTHQGQRRGRPARLLSADGPSFAGRRRRAGRDLRGLPRQLPDQLVGLPGRPARPGGGPRQRMAN